MFELYKQTFKLCDAVIWNGKIYINNNKHQFLYISKQGAYLAYNKLYKSTYNST